MAQDEDVLSSADALDLFECDSTIAACANQCCRAHYPICTDEDWDRKKPLMDQAYAFADFIEIDRRAVAHLRNSIDFYDDSWSLFINATILDCCIYPLGHGGSSMFTDQNDQVALPLVHLFSFNSARKKGPAGTLCQSKQFSLLPVAYLNFTVAQEHWNWTQNRLRELYKEPAATLCKKFHLGMGFIDTAPQCGIPQDILCDIPWQSNGRQES